ncbi:MAG: hypothetical protein AAB110_08075 [Candidatus Desantisbacteria bacterium]
MDILELFQKMGLSVTNVILMPLNFTRETVTKFNLQTIRRTLEIVSATWYANADRAYPENLEVKQFAQHLSPIPKVMLNLSIKEGNDSNQVIITESTELKPTGNGNVGGYLYNPLEGLIKINHAGVDISNVPYNEY